MEYVLKTTFLTVSFEKSGRFRCDYGRIRTRYNRLDKVQSQRVEKVNLICAVTCVLPFVGYGLNGCL
jgi:hypothetical protein